MGHLEGKADGKGHEHDGGALRVLHAPTAPAARAEGRPAGASGALTVLAVQENVLSWCVECGHYHTVLCWEVVQTPQCCSRFSGH